MFLHISTDQLICLVDEQIYILPYQHIEKTFGPRFLDLFKKYQPTHLYVLNGPGSFTLLRVCCLVIMLIKQQHKITIFTCAKPELLSWCFSTYLDFPPELCMTIGQKKHLRHYTCATKQEKKVTITERQNQDHLLLDPLVESNLVGGAQFTKRILQFSRQEGKITLESKAKQKNRSIDLHAHCRQQVADLKPNYLIEPTIG